MNKRYLTFLFTNRFLKRTLTVIVGASIALASCSKKDEDPGPTDNGNNNQNQNQTTLSNVDKSFIINTFEANKAEITVGLLAAQKAQKDSVKAFGSLMVKEHKQAQTELWNLATSKQFSFDTNFIKPRHQAIASQLNTLTGAKFDSLYMASQVVDHDSTLRIFNNEINGGQHQDVKGYANKYQPHIAHHFRVAKRIDSLFIPKKK